MFRFNKVRLVTLGAAALLSASHVVLADDHSDDARSEIRELKKEHRKEMRKMRHEHHTERMLARVDANKDGQVDLNEYLAHAEERFNKLDADGDGFVTQDEAKESMRKMREEHKERRKKMRQERAEQGS